LRHYAEEDKMNKMTEKQAYESYNDMLDEIQPLDGIACNCFSMLLQAGDPIAYNCRFSDYCDAHEIEIEED
jgi:hypothetical protein